MTTQSATEHPVETGMLARYVGAAVGARIADEGARVAIVLLALEQIGDPAVGGLLVAALMVPHVLAAPLVSAAADAARRRRPLYLTAFVVYALSLTATAVLTGRHTWPAAALLLVAGCLSPLLLGGLSSLLGELTPADLPRAFAWDAATYALASIAGPVSAAVIAGFAGATWSLLALSISALLGAVMFLTLPLPDREPVRERPRPATPLAGLRILARRPSLSAVTLATGLNQLGLGALPVAAASVAVFTHRDALTGGIMTAVGGGALAGSLLCTRVPLVRRHPERVLLLCTAATTLPLLLTALLPASALMLTLFAVVGLLSAPVTVALFAVRDREAPPELRTQVFTLGAGIKVTAAAAGAAASGFLASLGPAALLLTIAGCQALAALAGNALLRHGRTRPEA